MRRLPIAVLALACAGCTGGEHPAVGSASDQREPSATTTTECPVTLPTGDHRPRDPAGLGELGFGNGELFVGLWPRGRVRATEDNLNRRGAIVAKFPWDRAIRGRLRITGERLDADAPSLRAQLSDYGPVGFQASALVFPSQGCWEVTGRVADSTLTFVTKVLLVE